LILYLSDAPAGAIAESFGRFPEWSAAILDGSPSLPGSARAIARFHLPDDVPVCDLDDPTLLQTLGLRPSDIVSRDYTRSRHGLRGFMERERSAALWNIGRLEIENLRLLRLNDPAFLDASRTIARRIVTDSDGKT
jgi:hypothetical protein